MLDDFPMGLGSRSWYPDTSWEVHGGFGSSLPAAMGFVMAPHEPWKPTHHLPNPKGNRALLLLFNVAILILSGDQCQP